MYINDGFFSRNENNLEVSREKMQLQDTELSRLREHLSQNEQSRVELQNQLEQTNQHCRQLEQQLMEKDQSKKNVDSLLDQYRQQTHTEKELRQSKGPPCLWISSLSSLSESDKEAETLRSKMAQLTADYEQLSATRKEGEINEASARRKMEETNRTRQAVLDRTRDEYEKLLQKYDDLDEVYRALVDKQEIDSCKIVLLPSMDRTGLRFLHSLQPRPNLSDMNSNACTTTTSNSPSRSMNGVRGILDTLAHVPSCRSGKQCTSPMTFRRRNFTTPIRFSCNRQNSGPIVCRQNSLVNGSTIGFNSKNSNVD